MRCGHTVTPGLPLPNAPLIHNLSRLAAVVRRVLAGEEALLTLKAVAVLFVLGRLGRLASPVGLLFTGEPRAWG